MVSAGFERRNKIETFIIYMMGRVLVNFPVVINFMCFMFIDLF